MHSSVMHWMAEQVTALGLADSRVLEVGSLNVNGTVRRLFRGEYVGVDMRDGPDVDVVCNAHELSGSLLLRSRFYETVVCCEMLEHDDQPWESVVEMREMACNQAVLLLTARGYDARGCFPLHDYPQDLWRFSTTGMKSLLTWAGWKKIKVIPDPEAPGVFAVAHA
jgi:hypothetical protein